MASGPITSWHEKMKWKSLSLTVCNPMDSTVHGIHQARILEWVAFPFSRGSSQPRDWTQVSYIGGEFFISWATREAHFMAYRWGNSERLYFLGLQNHYRWWLQTWNYKILVPWKKSYDNLDKVLKHRDITLLTKVHIIKAMFFLVCESRSVMSDSLRPHGL